MSSRRFDSPVGGPRGLKGAETVRQGFVDVNAIIDREEIQKRIHTERTNNQVAKLKKKTDDEYDIAYNEFLITPIMPQYGNNDIINDIPVTSTAAGLKDARYRNIMRVLDDYQPAGLSMTRIVFKPENASVVPPQRKLASQIAGSFTADSYHHDMPFGALVRLELNPRPQSSHGYIGTNKHRLIPVPETNGQPFALRLQQRMWEHYHNPNKINVEDKDKSKIDLAMDDVFEAFADVIAVAMMVHDTAYDEDPSGTPQEWEQLITGMHTDKKAVKESRTEMMKYMFAGMNPTVKNANSDYLLNGTVSTDPEGSKKQRLQVEACARFFEKMMDAMRIDNMWAVAKVIKPTQAPGKFDAMMI